MSRNRSLDSLHLEGFEDIQTGHWVLQNDGHSGKRRFGPPRTPVDSKNRVFLGSSHRAGRDRHVGEWRRPSRCVPHHPAALPLGRPGHQRLGTHRGPAQIPDGGRVAVVGGWSPGPPASLPASSWCFLMFPDARRQHESPLPQFDRGFGRPHGTGRARSLYRCQATTIHLKC